MENDPTQNLPGTNQIQAGTNKNRSAAAQLKNDKEKIKSRWELKVRRKVSVAESQTSLALINSMEFFLDELADILEQSVSMADYNVGERGMSKLHGEQRARFAGYFLPQLFKEFSILREVILEDLQEADVLTYQIALTINGAIDSAISLAATEFAAVHQRDLKTALAQAEASNRDLEHFAAIAAHDLKSPLATISGYLELLVEDAGGNLNQECLKQIQVMQKAARRMLNLIDRLLEYGRLMKSDKSFCPIDLNKVMNAVLQNLHYAIEKNQARITYESLPTVNGDISLIAQIFQNLVANSIKFRREEPPRIQIEAVNQGEFVLFSVGDNGIGFDSKDKTEIFTLYKKLRGEVEYQGSGIGLATCKKVVELHGGRIWAESALGVGSTFWFTLPNPNSTSKASDN